MKVKGKKYIFPEKLWVKNEIKNLVLFKDKL